MSLTGGMFKSWKRLYDKDEVAACCLGGFLIGIPFIPIGILAITIFLDAGRLVGQCVREAAIALGKSIWAANEKARQQEAYAQATARQQEYERLRPQREAEAHAQKVAARQQAVEQAISHFNAVVLSAQKIADESMRFEVIGQAEIELREKLATLL